MKVGEALQKFIPFAYLYLVVLGIIKESVFYYFFDVNILKYSNLMDILISPVSDITSNPIILGAVVAILVLSYVSMRIISRYNNKAWARKIVGIKDPTEFISEEDMQKKTGSGLIGMIAAAFLSFFLGIGLGSGQKISAKIADNTIKHQHNLNFNTGEKKHIYLIGANSANYFYVEKGNQNIQISPVLSIKNIEILKNEKQ